MDKEYRLDKEYSVMEVLRYNLRMWWLAVICALLCAALLGGYKYKANHPFVEKVVYDNIQQAAAAIYVKPYSDETAVERAGTIVKIAKSNLTYKELIRKTGLGLDYQGYLAVFDIFQGEVSDVLSLCVNYPASFGDFSITDETEAVGFADEVIAALEETSREIIGSGCITVVDEPHASSIVQKIESYYISEEEFRQGVLKAATAGFLLGIIVEVVVYTCFLLLWKKPKNAEEIRQCMEAPVIDTLKDGNDNAETFRKVCLFFKEEEQVGCVRINCISLGSPRKDAALKTAMSFANEQKRTLFVNLAGEGEDGKPEHSVSRFVFEEGAEITPLALNHYLDVVCRTAETEKGFDLLGNRRFAMFLDEKSREYERIVIGTGDAADCADAYVAARLCDRSFLVCGRKNVKNETLYRVKNEADVNRIQISGILIYE